MIGRPLVAALVHVLVLAAAAAPARAGIWNDATGGATASEAASNYAKQMSAGNDEAAYAIASKTRASMEGHIDIAIAAYTTASTFDRAAGEPYARIAKVIYSFYFEQCADPALAVRLSIDDPSPLCQPFDRARAKQLVEAWNQLEAHSPMDPRIASCPLPGHWACAIFERAILNTKLADPDRLEAAARDYKFLIDHASIGTDLGIVANNLAETYMMLGRLDEAIDTYRLAMMYRNDVSTSFGLSVALDRDDQQVAARDIIEQVGPSGFKSFAESIQLGETFFVPEGEVFYYLALAHEVLGRADLALDEWQAFIKSGAHPQFQARARQHVATLITEQKLHPKILTPTKPRDPLDE